MSEKPSYLGLLNAIAVAESNAGKYFSAWCETTTDPDVRATIELVALREAEHGLAFSKRINELGFSVIDKPEPDLDRKIAIARSTTMTDCEKFEAFKIGPRPEASTGDIFDRMFENKDLDPQTGGLLGRYIAEERDTGRRLAACYGALSAARAASAARATSVAVAEQNPVIDEICRQVGELNEKVDELCAAIAAGAVATKQKAGKSHKNGKSGKNGKRD